MKKVVLGMTLLMILTASGCAERKMTVVSDPPGAVVFMDGVEKGTTPVTYKFNWYGGRRFTLKHDGYETCEEVRRISPPLHMRFPLDAIWDLTPLPAKDHKTVEFKLVEQGTPKPEELRQRAEELRARAYEDTQLKLKSLGVPPPEAGPAPESAEPEKAPEQPIGEDKTKEPAAEPVAEPAAGDAPVKTTE